VTPDNKILIVILIVANMTPTTTALSSISGIEERDERRRS